MFDQIMERRDFLKTLLAAMPMLALDWDSFPRGKSTGKSKTEFDAVIIGSGLGGLSCAAAFARQGFKPLEWVYQLRERMSQSLEDNLHEPQASLAQAVLLGKRSTIPDELRDSLSQAGTAHILAISGIHIFIFNGFSFGKCLFRGDIPKTRYATTGQPAGWRFEKSTACRREFFPPLSFQPSGSRRDCPVLPGPSQFFLHRCRTPPARC